MVTDQDLAFSAPTSLQTSSKLGLPTSAVCLRQVMMKVKSSTAPEALLDAMMSKKIWDVDGRSLCCSVQICVESGRLSSYLNQDGKVEQSCND